MKRNKKNVKLFDSRDLGEIIYYLGIEINKIDGIYILNQQYYIDKLSIKYSMQNASISKVPISVSYGKSKEEVLLPKNQRTAELELSLADKIKNLKIMLTGNQTVATWGNNMLVLQKTNMCFPIINGGKICGIMRSIQRSLANEICFNRFQQID